MMIAVESFYVVAIRRPKMFEAAVLIRVSEREAPIIRTVMPVPVIVIHVRHAVHAAAITAFDLGSRASVAVWWAPFWDVALVCMNATAMLLSATVFLTATLRPYG